MVQGGQQVSCPLPEVNLAPPPSENNTGSSFKAQKACLKEILYYKPGRGPAKNLRGTILFGRNNELLVKLAKTISR